MNSVRNHPRKASVLLTKPLRSVAMVSRSRVSAAATARSSSLANGKSGVTAAMAPAQDANKASIDQQRIEQLIAKLERQVSRVAQNQQELRSQIFQQAIELATALTSKVLGQEIQKDRFPLHEMVGQLCGDFQEGQSVTVYVHPTDLRLINQVKGDPAKSDEALSSLDTGKTIRWLADAGLSRGSARLEGVDQALFFSAAFQIEELHRTLREAVSDQSH